MYLTVLHDFLSKIFQICTVHVSRCCTSDLVDLLLLRIDRLIDLVNLLTCQRVDGHGSQITVTSINLIKSNRCEISFHISALPIADRQLTINNHLDELCSVAEDLEIFSKLRKQVRLPLGVVTQPEVDEVEDDVLGALEHLQLAVLIESCDVL